MVSYLDQDGVQRLVDKMRDRMYPVDSIYISTNSTSPASLYGGSWERYGAGRALISASDTDPDFTAGKTGGEKTHEHNLPNLFGQLDMGGTEIQASMVKLNSSTVWRSSVHTTVKVYADSSVHNSGLKISRPVNDDTNIRASSLQPYISVYVWRRTA